MSKMFVVIRFSLLLAISLTFQKCSEQGSSSLNLADTTIEKSTPNTSEEAVSLESTPDFISLSNNNNESFLGHLQGVGKNDSSGPYLRRDYFSDSLSFTIIYYPKLLSKDSLLLEDLEIAQSDGFKNFICFAFVFAGQNHKITKSYQADQITYPAQVKSYVRQDLAWQFYSQSTVKNLAELSQYEIETIFKNIP